MFTVDTYAQVRRAVLIEGRSRRSVAQELGLSRNTVAKMVKHHLPPGYRRKAAPVSPKLDAFTGIIDQILEDDKLVIKKQRHTAKGIVKLTSAKCKIPNFILTLMHSTDFGLWSAMNPNCV